MMFIRGNDSKKARGPKPRRNSIQPQNNPRHPILTVYCLKRMAQLARPWGPGISLKEAGEI